MKVSELVGQAATCYLVYRAITTVNAWRSYENTPTSEPNEQVKASPQQPLVTHKIPPVPENYFVTSHGFHLFTTQWIPKDNNIKAVLFLVHGLGEHAGRYEHIGPLFAERGFAVFMVDHQGHGRSDGVRMFARKFEDLIEDFMEFVHHILHSNKKYATLPRFLLGHSMGGVMALLIIKQQGVKWNGLLLTAPALYCHELVYHRRLLALAHRLSFVIPKCRVPPIDATALTPNPYFMAKYHNDPLKPHVGPTVRLGFDLVVAGVNFVDNGNPCDTPFLLCQGDKDPLCYWDGSTLFFDRSCATDKTFKRYPNAQHELFRHDFYEQVVEDMVAWATKRM